MQEVKIDILDFGKYAKILEREGMRVKITPPELDRKKYKETNDDVQNTEFVNKKDRNCTGRRG